MTKSNENAKEPKTDPIGVLLPPDNEQPRAEEDALLATAQHIGEHILGPNAQETDQASAPNRANFCALAEAGMLGLAIPRAYGGRDASGAMQSAYTQLLASYCGVTTFTQAQHHGPSRMIANGPNERLKQSLLPDLAQGKSMCGISFAHLRRPGPPVLRAEPVAGGLSLNGTAPWVTGWGLINQLVVGATLPNDRFVYVWSPANRKDFQVLFEDDLLENGERGLLVASAPIPLCAMNASATVELTFQNWFVPDAHRLSESDRETMRRNDRNGVLGATAMPIGCTLASIRLLRETAEKRSLPSVQRSAQALQSELEDAKSEIQTWSENSRDTAFFENAVRVRAWCIELALRAAHAAVTASSGAANTLSHPAQRLLREAMFYTVQAQTFEVMEATLQRLERVSSKED